MYEYFQKTANFLRRENHIRSNTSHLCWLFTTHSAEGHHQVARTIKDALRSRNSARQITCKLREMKSFLRLTTLRNDSECYRFGVPHSRDIHREFFFFLKHQVTLDRTVRCQHAPFTSTALVRCILPHLPRCIASIATSDPVPRFARTTRPAYLTQATKRATQRIRSHPSL